MFRLDTESTYYNEFLTNNDYMKKRYNLIGKIEYLTPFGYYLYCAKMFGTAVDKLKYQRERDNGTDYIEKLTNLVKKGVQFPLTYVDFYNHNQEGLHRMYAVANIYGWNKKTFPVLVVNVFDKNRELRENLLDLMNDYIIDAYQLKYLNNKEFEEELTYQLKNIDDPYFANPIVKLENDNLTITLNEITFDFGDDYGYIKYTTQSEREKLFEEKLDYNLDKWLEEI